MTLEFQFKEFLNEKRYINNSSQNTILFYEQAFKAFNLQSPLTRRQLNERVACLGSPRFVLGVAEFLKENGDNGTYDNSSDE